MSEPNGMDLAIEESLLSPSERVRRQQQDQTDHITAIRVSVHEADDYAFADEGDDCTRCGGDGFEECDDPIQCMRSYHIADEHECGACGGSGLAKDQTVW